MAGVRYFIQKKGKTVNNEKEYVDFLANLLVRVEEYFNGNVTGEICTSIKNNGVSATGLMLKGKEEQVAPNFYLEHQFIDWMRGTCTMEEIAVRLCKTYEEEVKRSRPLVSAISFDWENFRRNVFMRIVNTERNRELLKGIPHQEFLDLSVVYYYSVPISEGMTGTLVITREHLDLLGISEEELHETAKNNVERFRPAKVRCMEEVVCNLAERLGVEVQEASSQYPYLYVLTNKEGMFGAVSIALEEELKNFSKRINNSFYILPSSVHEVILLPSSEQFCVEYFSALVREINETQVDPTEVLSDSIYFYDKESNTVRRVV